MSYLDFVLANRRLLGFGFALAAFSSVGQTFFIALFGESMRVTFRLSHGELGGVYSAATLASAACLAWLGRKLDEVDLRVWTAFLCAGLAAACVVTAWSPTVVVLGVGFFGLRLFGQGLLGHAATTTMGRYFDDARGRAVSLASLGHPAGEALLPLPAVALAGLVGWRHAWLIVGLVVLVVAAPAALALLRGHAARHRAWLERHAAGESGHVATPGSVTGPPPRRLLGDPVFWLLLPASLASGYVLTGLFFHQSRLAEVKGWSLELIAASFSAWAAAGVVAALAAGPLVDRVGARRTLPFVLVPLALGLMALAESARPLVAPLYLGLAGVSQGLQFTTQGGLWAELYGVRRLGAVRAVISALAVFATALAPASMGALIDLGVRIDSIVSGCVGGIGIAIALAVAGLRLERRRRDGG